MTRRARRVFTPDREEVSRGLATRISRAPSTVAREIKRNGGRAQRPLA